MVMKKRLSEYEILTEINTFVHSTFDNLEGLMITRLIIYTKTFFFIVFS